MAGANPQHDLYELLGVADGLWAYRAGELTVLANLSGQPSTWAGPCGEVLLSTADEPGRGGGGVTLAPWQGVIARTAGDLP